MLRGALSAANRERNHGDEFVQIGRGENADFKQGNGEGDERE